MLVRNILFYLSGRVILLSISLGRDYPHFEAHVELGMRMKDKSGSGATDRANH